MFVPFLVVLICASSAYPQIAPLFSLEVKQTVDVLDYFPLQVGNRWVYEETRETEVGDPPRRVKTTWVKEVAIFRHESIPEGILIHRRERTLEPHDEFGGGWTDTQKANYRKGGSSEENAQYLIRGNYVFDLKSYGWDEEQKSLTGRTKTALETELAPDFFFPMSAGLRWTDRNREQADLDQVLLFRQGKGGAPNPGMYYWLVKGQEDLATPFRKIDNAYLVIYRTIGGTVIRWFKNGIGIVRERTTHSGSTIETNSLLKEFQLHRP